MDKLIDVTRMDNYYEQIVKKKFTAKQMISLVGSICAIILIIALCVFFSGIYSFLIPVALILLGFGIWLTVYLVRNSGIEYEYTFVTGEMRIERIKGKAKRRNITVFDIKGIDDIGKYYNHETGRRNVEPSKHNLVLHAEENNASDSTYYVLIHDKIRHKPALLMFTPNKMTLEKLRPYLSIELKKKFITLMKEEEKYNNSTVTNS